MIIDKNEIIQYENFHLNLPTDISEYLKNELNLTG
jgi:hypothetical protein